MAEPAKTPEKTIIVREADGTRHTMPVSALTLRNGVYGVIVKDGNGFMDTATDPVILAEHPVAVLVAITVYVPAIANVALVISGFCSDPESANSFLMIFCVRINQE